MEVTIYMWGLSCRDVARMVEGLYSRGTSRLLQCHLARVFDSGANMAMGAAPY